MSLITLVLKIVSTLLDLFKQRQSQATGAALQREKDMAHEENRIRAAAAADSLHGPDALDRDSPAA